MKIIAYTGLLLALLPRMGPAAAPFDAANPPVPPEQAKPWTAPATQLPPVVVSAIATLFDDGMADPRGCEYREIEIDEPPSWQFVDINSDSRPVQTIKTHGWVLPETGPHHYAIGWNGVIYPLKSVGAPVDLRREFLAMPFDHERMRFRGNGNGWPMSDQGSLSPTSALPIKTAFLLRLGHANLAEKIWNAGYAGEDEMKTKDPYADMASLWLGRQFNWAMEAYLKDDYATALAICRHLTPVEKRAQARAVAQGSADPWPDRMYGEPLWQLPILEAECERRVQEQPYTSVLESGLPAAGPERIAALIRDLERVQVFQIMNPGETSVYDDPTVQALIKEGNVAVEPLLKCLAEDDRLTRSRFTQGMRFDGPIIPVYEAAYSALFAILKTTFPLVEHDDPDDRLKKDPRHLSQEERQALAAKIEAFWQKTKGMPPVENGYVTLQDDQAGAKAWYRAIDAITQPADGSLTSHHLIDPVSRTYSVHADNVPFTPLGESLRGKMNPSVSDLILKRFEQLVQDETDHDIDLSDLSKVLFALADWDGKNHLDDLRNLGKELDARFVRQNGQASAEVNVSLVEKRLQLGDASALQDYVRYLQSLTPEQLKAFYQGDASSFAVMAHYPDAPAIKEVAARFFTGKDAPLVPLPNSLVPSSLIGVAAFRQELERGLGDTSPAGTVTVREGVVDYAFTATHASRGESPGYVKDEPFAPKPGAIIPFRLCDCYAYLLAQVGGFPACQLYWPEAQRSAVVALCKTYLAQYGDAYRPLPGAPYDDDLYSPSFTARFFIPQLDHPATPDEVKAGQALFSLSGTTRVWKMPQYPLGLAWQAEEVLVDGKWERYFGVLGNGKPRKVPAGEMEFPGSSPNVTKEISGSLEGPVTRGPEFSLSYVTNHRVPLNAPVPVTISLYNHNGLDQQVPDSVMLPPGAVRALPSGIGLSASYTETRPPVIQSFSGPQFIYGNFREIPLRKEVVPATEKMGGAVLLPAQKLTVLTIDLRDYFDLSRPGSYRVKAIFRVPGQPVEHSNEIMFSIADGGSKRRGG